MLFRSPHLRSVPPSLLLLPLTLRKDIVITPGVPSTTSLTSYLASLSKINNSAPYTPLVLPAPILANGGSAARGEGLMDLTMLSFFEYARSSS